MLNVFLPNSNIFVTNYKHFLVNKNKKSISFKNDILYLASKYALYIFTTITCVYNNRYSMSTLPSSSVLHASWGICGKVLLAFRHKPLQSLYVLPLCLVVHHVRHVLGENLLPTGTSVNTYHSDSDRPRSVAYCHL